MADIHNIIEEFIATYIAENPYIPAYLNVLKKDMGDKFELPWSVGEFILARFHYQHFMAIKEVVSRYNWVLTEDALTWNK